MRPLLISFYSSPFSCISVLLNILGKIFSSNFSFWIILRYSVFLFRLSCVLFIYFARVSLIFQLEAIYFPIHMLDLSVTDTSYYSETLLFYTKILFHLFLFFSGLFVLQEIVYSCKQSLIKLMLLHFWIACCCVPIAHLQSLILTSIYDWYRCIK